MWTGRQTLEQIEAAITKLHRDETRLDASLASATSQAERLRRERSDAFRELARVKLDEIEARRLSHDLDAAEARALHLLESRRLQLEAANAERATLIADIERAERDRHAVADAVETVLADVEALREAAEEQVRETTEWNRATEIFEAADSVATEAEKKARRAADELAAKQKPYDDDPLFVYLWTNGFGTSRYGSTGLARYVDRAIADFISFLNARPNYAMLIEIPQRLQEHAAAKRRLADGHQATLAAIERRAMVAAGVDEKERTLAKARHRLAAADDLTEKKRGLLQNIDRQRAALVDKTGDTSYTEALQTIASADAQDSLETLYREARRTGTSEDDRLVKRIGDIDRSLEDTESEIRELRVTARELAQRRLEIEQARDRFRSSGFDHPSATFGNEIDIGRVLGQILEGAVRSGILWDLLREGFGTRRRRSRQEFGAPTFPFPFPMPGGDYEDARGSEWREPGTRGGWGPTIDFPSMPSPGGASDRDDGFTTGGSF